MNFQWHLLRRPMGRANNARLKLVWVGTGKQDPSVARITRFSELLDGHKITHTFRVIEGGHTFAVWRQNLCGVAPLLFQASGK